MKFLSAFVLLVISCSSSVNPLTDTNWQLTDGDADIQFSATIVDGWTGCNGYGGEYSVDGDELRLIEVMATSRGCPTQELLEQEQRILGSLRSVERIEISGERLTIRGQEVLTFERVE